MKKIIGLLVVVLVVGYGLPMINWGRITMQPGEIVTVTGEAKTVAKNQIASFSAGVESVNDNKEMAVDEVNLNVSKLIAQVKMFGVKTEDIKTQSMMVNQDQQVYMSNGVQKFKKGQWRASNTIEIILRDASKASALADLLATTGATNVYGPNFRLDENDKTSTSLIGEAMKDAKDKANKIAVASGRKLGKVMSVNENGGGANFPVMYAAKDAMGGVGAPTEPGSTTISKSVTVVFELK